MDPRPAVTKSPFVSEEMSVFYRTCFNPILALSTSMQSGRNKRLLLSPFIQLSGGRMDWSQLIWQWQEASLLAQWPTFDKRRKTSAAQSLAKDWSLRCLHKKKTVVPQRDTIVRQRAGWNICELLHRGWTILHFGSSRAALMTLCAHLSVFPEPRRSPGEILKSGRFSGSRVGLNVLPLTGTSNSSTVNLFSFISRLCAPRAHFIFPRVTNQIAGLLWHITLGTRAVNLAGPHLGPNDFGGLSKN